MSDIIDGTIVTAEVAKELTKTFLSRIEGPVSKLVNNKVLIHLKSFEPYLSKTYRRCNSVRVLANREKIYTVDEIYVGPSYRCGEKTLDDNDIIQKLRDSGRIVVQGFGGIGKTVLLKHVWLNLFNFPEGKIPVFIELRRFNDLKTVDILAYISTTISTVESPLSVEDFQLLLSSGRFILVFDGFDEISDDRRDEVEIEILSLASEYPEVGIIVSSRRDDRFVSWGQFEIFSAQRYNKSQISQIVQKIEFDKPVKRKFLKEIIEDNFSKYEDFLSTPLLALMMLLTYRQFADIPEKIHLFYRYAYQTLFSLHDASKEAFKRKRKTNLDEDEFAKLFSVFCLMSYIEYDLSFSYERAIEYIDKAKRRTSVKVDSRKFLEELVESVNLLYKEGEIYSFVHRSFQEYFSSYSIVNVFSGDIRRLIARISFRPGDTVMQMAYEMNTDLVESAYFVQEYEAVKSDIDKLLTQGFSPLDGVELLRPTWVFVYTVGRDRERRLLLTMLVPGHSMWDLMRKATICFSTAAATELGDSDVVALSDEVKVLAAEVLKRATSAGGDKASMIAASLDKTGVHTVSVDGEEADLKQWSDLFSIESSTTQKFVSDWVVVWRAHAVFLNRQMKNILKRERSRKITLDDIL